MFFNMTANVGKIDSVKNGSMYLATTEGRIYQLSNYNWLELEDQCNNELRFKRISCCPHSLWAVCGDHQIYVRVLESDVPIRVREDSYENQRWNPLDGFCDKLLPTDRPPYSTSDGLAVRELVAISLPSKAWVWDDEWHLDLIHEGQHLDSEVVIFSCFDFNL